MRIRIKRRYFFRLHPRQKAHLSVFCIFLSFLILCGSLARLFLVRIHPSYISHVQLFTRNLATKKLNQSLIQLHAEENDCYKNFVRLSFHQNGYVSAIETDSARMNHFKTQLLSELSRQTEQNSSECMSIPFGALLPWEVLSGIGPNIPVTVRTSSIAKADFSEEFTTVGINQVKHRIYLNISMSVCVISCFGQRSETVSCIVPVAESIIVGEVPNYYAAGSIVPAVDAEISAEAAPTFTFSGADSE